jgi:hypothetical protein
MPYSGFNRRCEAKVDPVLVKCFKSFFKVVVSMDYERPRNAKKHAQNGN